MFGYIRPYKPEMKMGEFDTFKAIYCGLCRELKSAFGPFSSLTLSYDFTFIATVALGLSQECGGFKKCACVANPLKKKPCHVKAEELTFCGACAMLMIYYKIKDDIKDSGFIGKIRAIALLPFAKYAQRKAKKLYPNADSVIAFAIAEQDKLEKAACASLDKSADPTATALGKLCEMLSLEKSEQAVLYRFGYLTGRYVYFSDALDDFPKDKKSSSFNPFLIKLPNASDDEIRTYATQLINITIAELAAAYELLPLKRFKPILDNIIYLGLKNSIDEINKKESVDHEQSL